MTCAVARFPLIFSLRVWARVRCGQPRARGRGRDTPAVRDWTPAWPEHGVIKDSLSLTLGVDLVVGDRLPLGLEVVVPAGLVYTQRGVERFEGNFLN